MQANFGRAQRITDRETDYQKRRLNRIISPERNDAFAMGDKTPDARVSTYADRLREAQLNRERDNTMRNIAEKQRQQEEDAAAGHIEPAYPTKASGLPQPPQPAAAKAAAAAATGKRRNRWDQGSGEDGDAGWVFISWH